MLVVSALAASLHLTVAPPQRPVVRSPQKKVEANPTPHPKVVSPHPGARVSANPTPHPYPVPVIDLMVHSDRLELVLRGTDGKTQRLMTSPGTPTETKPARRLSADGIVGPKTWTIKKHVDASTPFLSMACDGVASDGNRTWSFGARSSFLFADGSKVTFNKKRGTNRCASVDIMHDGERVRLSVDAKGAAKISKPLQDRWKKDAATPDGIVYVGFVGKRGKRFHWGTIRKRKGTYVSGGVVRADGSVKPGKSPTYQLTDIMLTSLVDQGTLKKAVDGGGSTKGLKVVIDNGAGKVAAHGGGKQGIVIIGNKPAAGEDKGIIIIGNKPAAGKTHGVSAMRSKPASGEDKGIIIINGLTGHVGPKGIELHTNDLAAR